MRNLTGLEALKLDALRDLESNPIISWEKSGLLKGFQDIIHIILSTYLLTNFKIIFTSHSDTEEIGYFQG